MWNFEKCGKRSKIAVFKKSPGDYFFPFPCLGVGGSDTAGIFTLGFGISRKNESKLRQLFLREILNETKPTPSESDPSGWLEALADVLSSLVKIPIVVIQSTQDKYVRPFLPTLSLDGIPNIIYIAHNVGNNRFYNTKDKGKIPNFFCYPYDLLTYT